MIDTERLFSPASVKIVAQYIADRFEKGVSDRNMELVDYEYDLSRSGKMSSEEDNTEYMMDAEGGTLLMEIIDAFFHDDETRIPTESDFATLDQFTNDVIEELNANHVDQLRKGVKTKVLKGAPDFLFPLSSLKVNSIELSNETFPYTISVMKRQTEETMRTTVPERVAEALGNEYMATKKPLEQIIAEKKAVGDPLYQSVYGATMTKEYYHVHMNLWVDYSQPPQKEGIPEKVEN